MDPKVQTALIAGVVSLIVSVITYFATRQRIQAERDNLADQLRRGFTEKLYALRLDIYIEAFDITQDLGKKGGRTDKEIIAIIDNAAEKLSDWRNHRAALVLSEKALDAYYSLTKRLKRNPGDGTAYTEQQITNIWNARNSFRGALRNDIGLIYVEDRDAT